jgi:hypothetical protein
MTPHQMVQLRRQDSAVRASFVRSRCCGGSITGRDAVGVAAPAALCTGDLV